MQTNVNLKLLHTFLLVAELKSFRRAADESNRSQSAISMQVRQLEQQLDIVLFHRTTRSVRLTREGEMLLENVRRAMQELQTGFLRIKDAAELQSGRLSLACTPTIAASRLPEVLGEFHRAFPGMNAHVRELRTAEMLDAIRDGDVDFGIGARMSTATDFKFHPVAVDRICALVPVGMELAERKPDGTDLGQMEPGGADGVPLANLADVPLLILNGSASLLAQIEDARAAAGLALDMRHEVSQVQTQVAMAAAGLGVAILPQVGVPAMLDPRLRVVPIVDPPLSREICIITLRGRALPPAALRFATLLQAALSGRATRQPDGGKLSLVVRNG